MVSRFRGVRFVGIPCGLIPYGSSLVLNAPCLSSAYTTYDWVAFVADVMFYLVITFGVLLVSTKYLSRKPAGAVASDDTEMNQTSLTDHH